MAAIGDKELFRVEMAELLDEMECGLLELERAPGEPGKVNRVFRSLHTVKGAATMFGFKEIAALTHAAESAFDQVRAGLAPVSKELLDVSLRFKDKVLRLMDATPGKVDPGRYQSMLEWFRDFAAHGAPPESAAALDPALPDAPGPAGPPLEQSQAACFGGQSAFLVRFRLPEAQDNLRDVDPLAVLDDLRALAPAAVVLHCEAMPLLDALDPLSARFSWEALLEMDASEDNENAIRDAFLFLDEGCGLCVEAITDARAWKDAHVSAGAASLKAPLIEPQAQPCAAALASAIGPAPPATSVAPAPLPPPAAPASSPIPPPRERRVEPRIPVVVPSAAPQPPVRDGAAAGQAAKREPPSSIRVDAFKLDDTVSLVGELVIAQARLSQVVTRLHDPGLLAVSEEIERLSASLRDRTLSMRMLPIGVTFDRFRRLVRDLSQDLGKEIELLTQGAETELDKTVIDQLGDPLTHLLRNCIDHGVETPAEREAKGKPRRGTILLEAIHSGGFVLIKISDDGKGLDRDRIAAKGVARKLIVDAAQLSDGEIFNLIFLPGFSTAETVTNISGRGVGMDVVKKSIDALRGTVSLDSKAGKGTTITVKIPLTLAIIEGLQVRVDEEFFVIPLSAVEECVELRRAETVGTKEKRIINLRGEIVPYIRLREWFATPGTAPAIEQIIITGDGMQHTGIVVDEVIGQQQTVIKRLGKIFSGVEEISGATIRGDGSMALILDIPLLARKAREAARVEKGGSLAI